MQGLTLFKSSAGSGKTFTLVLEYLKLVLLNPVLYRQVLAVTFTNKATDEMKNRIVETLAELGRLPAADLPNNAYYQKLQAHVAEKGLQEKVSIPENARKTLNLILNDYSSFSVSTIESFFQRIVRAFAKELNIPLGYDIEMQQQLVLERLVGDMMLELGENQELTRLMEGYAKRNLEEEKSWHVDREVLILGGEIFKERFQSLMLTEGNQEDIIPRTLDLVKELQQIRHRFQAVLKEKAETIIALIESFALQPIDFSGGSRSPAHYFYNVRDKGIISPTDAQQRAAEIPEKWFAKKSPNRPAIEALIDAGFLGQYQAMLVFLEEQMPMYVSAQEVLKNLHSFGLIRDLNRRLAEYRKNNQALIISDTGFLLNRIVRDAYDAPFIYEKVGTQFLYYLIDEFQDTSDMQWKNLFPLVREVLSSGLGSLLVGDVKQSIYRWRNGNMRLLMQQVEEQVKPMGIEAKVNHLDANWRTAAEVVEFNNDFFEATLAQIKSTSPPHEQAELDIAYLKLRQTPQKTKESGLVEVRFFETSTDEEGNKTHWKDQSEAQLLLTLSELQADGFQLGDATLLVRTNREGMRLAEFLQEHRIKVASAESLLVDSHPAVQFLHHALSYLNHEQNPITIAALVYSYAKIVEEQEASHELFTRRDIGELIPTLQAAQTSLRQLSVFECLEQLIQLFEVLTTPNAYVQGFQNAALEYVGSFDASISGFLDWWEEVRGRRAIAAPSDPEAVQIMTIHKAKGLEFPVVLIPFAEWKLGPGNGIMWVKSDQPPFDKMPYLPVSTGSALEKSLFADAYREEKFLSLLDSLNMLYVAFTRPQFRLYVSTQGGKAVAPDKAAGQVGQLLRQSLSGWLHTEIGAGGDLHRWGNAANKPLKDKEEDSVQAVELVRNPDTLSQWNQTIRIKFHGTEVTAEDLLQRAEKRKEGEQLHEALALLETLEDIPMALKGLKTKGLIEEGEESKLKQMLTQCLSLPEVAPWYSGEWKVKNEAEIIHPNGSSLRPDRVMIQGKNAIVIDYKSGQAFPSHRRQLKRYQESLEQLGFEQVQAFIYYFLRGEVVAV